MTPFRPLWPVLVAGIAAGCGGAPAAPADAPPRAPGGSAGAAFPDSITAGRGLPPWVADSTTRALGGDTLVQVTVAAFPAYAVPRTQVGPGADTAGPMRLEVRALARDTSQSTLRTHDPGYAPCPVVLRLHRTAGRSDPPAWRSDAATGGLACPPVVQYLGSADATVHWDVPTVLGDSLAAGHYAFSYAVRLADGRSLEYAAGRAYLTADPAPPSRDRSSLHMAARSEVSGLGPRMLQVAVTVRNTGPRPVSFEHGACNVRIRLYPTAARTGPPSWRSEFRAPPGGNVTYGCPLPLYTSVVAPGDSTVFAEGAPLYEVLADSLPAGRYFVAAELELLDDALSPDRWRTLYRLDAGAVEFPRMPDRLPSARSVGGLAYTATTRLVPGTGGAGDTVRTLVLVTNTGTARAEAEVTRDCPVITYAYRSAALRDSVPIQEPVWQSPSSCQVSPHRFALAPGESWVFQHGAPAAEVVARAGAGRYYFTAWVAGVSGAMLAAGDLELGR
jgi:hypothetical protein